MTVFFFLVSNPFEAGHLIVASSSSCSAQPPQVSNPFEAGHLIVGLFHWQLHVPHYDGFKPLRSGASHRSLELTLCIIPDVNVSNPFEAGHLIVGLSHRVRSCCSACFKPLRSGASHRSKSIRENVEVSVCVSNPFEAGHLIVVALPMYGEDDPALMFQTPSKRGISS